MDTRLSDIALVKSLDAGHSNLPWEPGPLSGLLASIDCEALIKDPHAPYIIPELPVQALYYAIKEKGINDSLELLPYLTQEQVERMLDYEAWSQDQLQPKKLFEFLLPFAEHSTELFYQRFAELDEEYQLASLSGLVRTYEVEQAFDLPPEVEDRVTAMPCQKVFYEILSDDETIRNFVERLIQAALEFNPRYAYALLGYSHYVPPAESEEQLLRFRLARLEEDGFVSFAESQELFQSLDRFALLKKWQASAASASLYTLAQQSDDSSFLIACLGLAQKKGKSLDELFELHQKFLYLANALCAATQVEPGDRRALSRLLEQGQAMVSLGLEFLAQGDHERGLAILEAESAKTLFRTGVSLMDSLRAEFLQKLKALQWPRADILESYHLRRQWGQLLLELDRSWSGTLGLISSEVLRGLWNRFPMVPMRLMSDETKIVFQPVASLRDWISLEQELQCLLGMIAVASWSPLPKNQPIELILQAMAEQDLRCGDEENFIAGADGVPALLEGYRQRLVAEKSRWWMLDQQLFSSLLDEVIASVHHELHGLIVKPRSTSQADSFEKGLNL